MTNETWKTILACLVCAALGFALSWGINGSVGDGIGGLILGFLGLARSRKHDDSGDTGGAIGELGQAGAEAKRAGEAVGRSGAVVADERAELDADRKRADRDKDLNAEDRNDLDRERELLDELRRRNEQDYP